LDGLAGHVVHWPVLCLPNLLVLYRDRKVKKRDFRQLWQLQINAAVRPLGINYSRFVNGLKKKNIELDRKVLAQLVEKHPDIFKKIVEEVKAK
jgi:large subunit ribosomal protein L20